MKKILQLKKQTNSCYNITVGDDGHAIGRAIMDVDGFFYYSEYPNLGITSSYTLRTIADLLDELNKPMDEQLNKYFNEQENKAGI